MATWGDVRSAVTALPGVSGACRSVPDVGAKEALISDAADVFFTTPHFDGYPAVLVRLELITVDVLEELIVEAWLNRAPKRMVNEYVANRQ